MAGTVGYVLAGFLGLLVGGAEIVSRYRDDPAASLSTPAALFYMAVNTGASILALYAIRAFGWHIVANAGRGDDLARVFAAGMGSLALLRTKFASVGSKDNPVSLGPSRLIEQLLAVADVQMDRKQGQRRARRCERTMTNVDFDKACLALPAYVLGLLENPTQAQQDKLSADIKSLSASEMPGSAKSQNLGLLLMDLTGPELLQVAVEALGRDILVEGEMLQPTRQRAFLRRFSDG